MRFYLFLTAHLIYGTLLAQDLTVVSKAQKIVWCGLDYSEVRCIGSEFFANPDMIVNEYFTKWNDLVIVEPDKYIVTKVCGKKPVVYNLDVAAERNRNVSIQTLLTDQKYELTEEQIVSMVAEYPRIDQADVGLVLIVESLNKMGGDVGVMHAVFFSTADKKILWTKKYFGKTGGFGFRNHWATPIAEILNQLRKDYKKLTKS